MRANSLQFDTFKPPKQLSSNPINLLKAYSTVPEKCHLSIDNYVLWVIRCQRDYTDDIYHRNRESKIKNLESLNSESLLNATFVDPWPCVGFVATHSGSRAFSTLNTCLNPRSTFNRLVEHRFKAE